MSKMFQHQVSRRTFFKGMIVLTAGAALAACTGPGGTQRNQAEPRGFDESPRPLPIPPLDEGEVVDGVRIFNLTAAPGEAELLAGITTATWGFNGAHLGPTLRSSRSDRCKVTITNNLDEMTTIHWHGMNIPAWADGAPHSPIEPGGQWVPSWEIDQAATTLWYHPHPHGRTALHCYRGLAGMFIIDDDVSDSLDLPRDYGVDDIPVIITDQKFTDSGQLDETDDPVLGLMGDTPLINGQANVQFQASTTRLRLRVLNASSMRFHNIALDDDRPFHIIAADQGLFAEPLEVDSVLIGPAERVEILVDLEPGKDITLRSAGLDSNFGLPDDEYAPNFRFRDTFDLLPILAPAESTEATVALPAVLDPAASQEPDLSGAPEREFLLNTYQINGQTMDMNRVDFVIDHQGPEIWKVTNENPDWPHNFHIHDSRFKVLSITGTDVTDVFDSGWKDTVAVPPNATVTLAVEFGYHPDPTVPYMYHCHMLYHEDQGMMGQFVITALGQGADLKPMTGTQEHHGH
ncbi:multicopper oxidase domain-containing protein [Corynebacterium sp. S7]